MTSQSLGDVGKKLDDGKAQFSLVPPFAHHELAKVLTFGAKKYSADNWRKVPNAKTRYTDAALRHVNAYLRGEPTDSESDLHHLAHAMACLSFILEFELVPSAQSPAPLNACEALVVSTQLQRHAAQSTKENPSEERGPWPFKPQAGA